MGCWGGASIIGTCCGTCAMGSGALRHCSMSALEPADTGIWLVSVGVERRLSGWGSLEETLMQVGNASDTMQMTQCK